MEILGKLFGSESKVKIMRLFLFNPEQAFTPDEVGLRTKTNRFSVRHELSLLKKICLIKRKVVVREQSGGNNGNKKNARARAVRRRVAGWTVNDRFSYLIPLQNLLITTALLRNEELVVRLSGAGRLTLLFTAGIFIQDPESRVDLLIVGDNVRRGALENIIKGIETELGRELRYAIFETPEFKYRLGMYDKLIRDILDYPHKVVLDRIGVSLEQAEK